VKGGEDAVLEYGFGINGDKFFIRLSHSDVSISNVQTGDSDGDGVSNLDEVSQNTDPLSHVDVDLNGLSDHWEIYHELGNATGTSTTATADLDGDGLTNAREQQIGTNPNLADTDGDTIKDDEDGWALCPDLAPARLNQPHYVAVEIHEGGMYTYSMEINNSNHALFMVTDDDYDTHGYYYAQGVSNHLPLIEIYNPIGFIGSWNGYSGLNDDDYFIYNGSIKTTYHSNGDPLNLDNDGYTYPQVYHGEQLIRELPDLLFNGEHRHYIGKANLILPGGNVVGRYFNQFGSVNSNLFEAEWNVAGDLQILDQINPDDELISVYPYNEVNALGVALMARSQTWGREQTGFGFWLSHNNTSFILESTTPGGESEPPETARINHKNTISASYPDGSVAFWIDSMAGIRNDQAVNANLTLQRLHKINWQSSWGAEPPANLNTQMRGFTDNRIWQNGEWLDLDSLIINQSQETPSWTNIVIGDMNDSGACIASATNDQDNLVMLLLLPIEIAVDGNRDGTIEFGSSADRTEEEKPYRFWINDDEDGDDEAGEVVPATRMDSEDDVVETKRDLEDLTRIWLNIGGFHEQLESGEIELGFKWADTNGSTPSIKIYWAADSEGKRDYLFDEDAAAAQLAENYKTALATVSSGNTSFIDKKVFADISSTEGKVYFLYEGVTEGSGKLTSVIKIGGNEYEAASVDLRLLHVRNMYERVKVTPDNPDSFAEPSEFVGDSSVDPNELPETPNVQWVEDPNGKAFVEDPEEEKEYLIFVHGWRMTYEGSQKYAESMFKRLWHTGYRGRYAFVRWPTYSKDTHPTTEGLFTYNISDYRAWVSGEGVAQFVNSRPPAYVRNIAAHSMGNIVVSSALREGMNVENYALLNAAIPAMCYDGDEGLYLFPRETPDGDADPITKSLGFKEKITGENVRRSMINFYLANDSALTGLISIPLVGEVGGWENNNQNFKPQPFLHTPGTGYKYEPENTAGTKVFVKFSNENESRYRNLRSFHESAAYATVSRTKTVGADGRTAGVINDKVDLDAKYGFGSTHSAQWVWRVQNTYSFYYDLMDKFELEPVR